MSDHKSSSEVELARLEGTLRTVQLALEILTGACATLPDPEADVLPKEGEDDSVEVDDDGKLKGTVQGISEADFRNLQMRWMMLLILRWKGMPPQHIFHRRHSYLH